MPLPVLAGLPWLAGVIATAFVSAFNYFLKYVLRRLVVVTAFVAAIVTATGVFFTAITAAASSVSASAPPWVSDAIGLVMPSNAAACISAIITAYIARFTYDWVVNIAYAKLEKS